MRLVSFFLLNLCYPYAIHWFTRILTTVTMHGAQRIHPIWIGFSTYRNALSESFVELDILPILHLFFGLLMSLKFLTYISVFFVACFMYSYHNNLLPNTFNTIFGTNHQVNTYTGNANNCLLYFCRTNIKQFKILQLGGPKLWNSFPHNLVQLTSYSRFKTSFKEYLITRTIN